MNKEPTKIIKQVLRHYIRFIILWSIFLLVTGFLFIIYDYIGLIRYSSLEFTFLCGTILAVFLLYIKILEWEKK